MWRQARNLSKSLIRKGNSLKSQNFTKFHVFHVKINCKYSHTYFNFGQIYTHQHQVVIICVLHAFIVANQNEVTDVQLFTCKKKYI